MRLRLSLPLKLMLSYLLVAALITLPAFWFLRGSLIGSLEAAEQRELETHAEAVRSHLGPLDGDALDEATRSLSAIVGCRITVVDRTGRVLADSSVAADAVGRMENHATRPEIKAAYATGRGVDVRQSESLKEELIYVAVPLDSDRARVVRLAAPRAKIRGAVLQAFLALRVGIGVGLSTALLLSLIAALYVAAPLRRMRDLARAYAEGLWPEVNLAKSGDEIEDLGKALIELGKQLRKQLVSAGAPEALLVQAVDAAGVGAVFGPDGEPVHLSSSFRLRLGWTAQSEQRETALVKKKLLDGDVHEPRTIDVEGRGGARTSLLATPLRVAEGAPYWFLVQTRETGGRGASREALGRLEASLRKRGVAGGDVLAELDALGVALSAPDTDGRTIETVSARALVEQCVRDINEENRPPRIVLSGEIPDEAVVDYDGAAARCLRTLLRASLVYRGEEGSLDVSARSDDAGTTCTFGVPFDAYEVVRDDLEPAVRACDAAVTATPDRLLSLTLPSA